MSVDLSTLSALMPLPGPTPIAVSGLAPSVDRAAERRIDETAQDFEALVLAQLLAPVFAGVEKSPLTGGGPGEEAFERMLQDHYAQAIAKRGGFGIAEQVKASLIALQAAANPSSG
ncbi:MAG: rod-binding protein [Pseudomonadota bacterium]